VLRLLLASCVRSLAARGPARQLDPRAGGQDLEHFQEREVVDPLQETDLVAAGPAGPEAVPGPAARVHSERRRPLLVEGTARDPAVPGLLEPGHALADHVFDRRSKLDRLDRSAELFVVQGQAGRIGPERPGRRRAGEEVLRELLTWGGGVSREP